MKTVIRFMAVAVGLMLTQYALAQTAPAGSTGICKDGTYTTSASKSGACHGHKGVQTWLAGDATAAAAAPAAKATKAAKAEPAVAAATGPAPAGATGLCKDGTYTTSASKSGACHGHKGVQTWMAAETAAPAKAAAPVAAAAAAAPAAKAAPAAAPMAATPATTPAAKAAPATHASAASMPQAAGGGPGMVWVNTASNVYHCPGSSYYGKTKTGAYMTEADAKAKGAHPDHNHPCTK
jgi:hypothetical protein